MQATIQNEFLSLTVDTHGAEAVSLKNAAGEELLWQADPAVWKRHAPILFPWTGKLKDGSFTHGGKTYKGGQHGFARDVEHTLLKAEGDTIQLELRPDEAMKAEKFPFDFVLTSTFRLDGKTLHHTLTVSNPGAEELRFGIGYHPAFQVPFDDSHFNNIILGIVYEITLRIQLNICHAFFRYNTARHDINGMHMCAFKMHAQFFFGKITHMNRTADTAVITARKRQHIRTIFSCQLPGNPYSLCFKILQVLK